MRLRAAASGRDGRIRHYFSVPDWIARELDPERRYEPMLTDHGILYLPVDPEPPVKLPAWVTQRRNGKRR